MSVDIAPTTRDVAAAVLAHAATTEEPGGEDVEPRRIVHCLLNGCIGADWDLAEAVDLLDKADGIYWHNGLAGHDLSVIAYNGPRLAQFDFEVRRPAVLR